ncbi:3'-5'-exoribonuclease [Aureococcus anophagefferens]|nr:3'-5'-exoribonuclease [Aureococcus anophagefferens]
MAAGPDAAAEVKFMLSNESDSPTDVGAYQLVEANSTVEEFMLLANVEVAKFLEEVPRAHDRHHPAPPER